MSRLSYSLSPAEKRTFYGTAKLPDEFIKHLRTLFEHLDTKNEGYIKITELEQYWGNEYHLDETMSNSVIVQRLYEFASNRSTGTISFPRFCAGVKDALLDVKVRKKRPKSFINALDLSGLDLNSSDEIKSIASSRNGSPSKKPQVRRSATVRERGRVERNDRRRRTEFAHMEQRSLDAYYEPDFQREEIQGILDSGIQMLDKIKTWYSRKHSQLNYNSKFPLDSRILYQERKKVEQLNKELEQVMVSQSQRNGINKTWANKSETQVIIEQREKIAQLESEKSLLIRELFQMKAQLKSPVAKSGFALFS